MHLFQSVSIREVTLGSLYGILTTSIRHFHLESRTHHVMFLVLLLQKAEEYLWECVCARVCVCVHVCVCV